MIDPPGDALFPERFVPEEMRGLIEAEHLSRYAWASTLVAGCNVLDAGCGVGYGSALMRDAGAAQVTGVDIDEDAIGAARRRGGEAIEFLACDIADMPLEDSSFDVVVCFEAIEHVQDQSRTLDELRRVLRPTGLLVMSSPNRHVYEQGNPYHTHEYTPEELSEVLGERFANVQLRRQQAWLLSMICDEQTLAESDPRRALVADLRKLAAVAPGRETFTLALASDGLLPAPGSLAAITDLGELSSWRDRARSAEAHLALSEQATHDAAAAHDAVKQDRDGVLAELEQTRHELELTRGTLAASEEAKARQEHALDDVNTRLAERNAALRLATEELTDKRRQVDALEARLSTSSAVVADLTSSASWRLTAPLRALARAVRRT